MSRSGQVAMDRETRDWTPETEREPVRESSSWRMAELLVLQQREGWRSIRVSGTLLTPMGQKTVSCLMRCLFQRLKFMQEWYLQWEKCERNTSMCRAPDSTNRQCVHIDTQYVTE